MVLKKTKIKISYIRLNFRIVRQSGVPFGTRRFNQLNKQHTFRCSNLTLRLIQIGLVFLWLLHSSLLPFGRYMLSLLQCRPSSMRILCLFLTSSGSLPAFVEFSSVSRYTCATCNEFFHLVLCREFSYYLS